MLHGMISNSSSPITPTDSKPVKQNQTLPVNSIIHHQQQLDKLPLIRSTNIQAASTLQNYIQVSPAIPPTKFWVKELYTTTSQRRLTMPLEIASFSLPSALLAINSTPPPSRIELCADASVGGLTPILADFTFLKSHHSVQGKIPIHVMIRPHARDFIYSGEEVEEMIGEIGRFKEAGVDGFVFGCLKAASSTHSSFPSDGEGVSIDQRACQLLLQAAEGRKCTFHRAFDSVPNLQMEEALEVLIKLGFTGLLTSGGAKSAVEGKESLRYLVEMAGKRIEIIVGGGVRSGNVEVLRRATGAEWFHSSAVVDGGEIASQDEVRRLGLVI